MSRTERIFYHFLLKHKMYKSSEADGCCFYRPGSKQTCLFEETLCEEADTCPKSFMSGEDVMATRKATWILYIDI